MSDNHFRILIVDDEPNIRSGLAKALAEEADEVATAKDGSEALGMLKRHHHDLVITDLKMPGLLSGLELIEHIKHERPETLILVITAHGTVETAVEAMRLGAHDYMTKPLDLNVLRLHVRNAFKHHRLVEENRQLRQRLAATSEFPQMVGQSAAMREVLARIRLIADTDVTVMIQGESGTGKELVARALHNLSARRGKPFVAASIGAVPETLIESELFGHEKGAFTGAGRQKPGWFEMAHGGTLFLDEVGEMPAKTQVDLLRVLEQREIRRLGGEVSIPVDVRLVTATHRDIAELVSEGKFREDLYYRLNVVPLRVPPLRERRDDIPLLVKHFLVEAQQRHQRPAKEVAGAAMRILCDYSWPGNVRQLRNCMERLVVTVEGPTIHAEELPEELRLSPRPDVVSLEYAVQEAEKVAILAALAASNQHRERAAQALGISVRSLHYKMNRYGLQ
ncbi:MAG TPA: sigma-54 dependent transcriptional regulator [Gemmataceae bacterium]|nr:sigma-54 dependent transcriptional regulator [Gemmataceae bacterium]